MNQKGEIQVVGGISEKIEGFYSACKKQGLNDNQGVIIPKNNSRNLILSDEVTNAIEEGKFTIYTVERVEEAIEILMDVKFDEVKRLVIEMCIRDSNNTIKYKIEEIIHKRKSEDEELQYDIVMVSIPVQKKETCNL